MLKKLLKYLVLSVVIVVLSFFGAVTYTAVKNYLKSHKPKTWTEALREYMGPPEYESIDRNKPLDQQTAIVEIAGRTFEIPKVFIESNLRGQRVQTGLNLVYVLPDFTSLADFPHRQAYKEAFREGRMAHMMIQNAAPRPSFDIVISNRRSGLTKEEHVGQHDGFEHYKWYHGKPEAPEYWSDVYLEKDEGEKIIGFIECSLEARVPHCSHTFLDKALRYKITYNTKNYFTEWRQQRSKAIAFVDSFEIDPTAPATKENVQ